MRYPGVFATIFVVLIAFYSNCSQELGHLSTSSQTISTVTQWNLLDPQQFPVNVSYNPNEIEITGNGAALAKVGNDIDSQIEFGRGIFSGTKIANNRLTLDAASSKQTDNNYVGMYESNIFDAGASAPWSSIVWVTPLPFHKEISTLSDETANYTDLAPNLSNGLVGLWHFNETTAYTGTAGEIKDSSGRNRHGFSYLASVQQSDNSRFGRGLYFPLANPIHVRMPNPVVGARSNMSFSLWIKTPPYVADPAKASQQFQVMTMGGGAGRSWFFLTLNNNVTPTVCANTYWGTPATDFYFGCESGNSISIANNQWHHLLSTYDRTGFGRFYVDGKFISQIDISSAANIDWDMTTNITLGEFPYQARQFVGEMDDLAVWSRELSANEVSQIYRRGANRIKFQVRSCDDKNCSGEQWQGPGASTSTWYSELQNTTVNYANLSLNANNNRYFQYRAALESDDTSKLCNGQPCFPEMTFITFPPVPRFFSDISAITAQAGIVYNKALTSFEVPITGNCSVKVQFSNDNGKTFNYWNGTQWAASNGTDVQSTDLATANQKLNLFMAGGIFRFRLFLVPNAGQACSVATPQIH